MKGTIMSMKILQREAVALCWYAFSCTVGTQETLLETFKGYNSGPNYCCQLRDSGQVDILELFHLNKSNPSPETSLAIFLIRDRVTKC